MRWSDFLKLMINKTGLYDNYTTANNKCKGCITNKEGSYITPAHVWKAETS